MRRYAVFSPDGVELEFIEISDGDTISARVAVTRCDGNEVVTVTDTGNRINAVFTGSGRTVDLRYSELSYIIDAYRALTAERGVKNNRIFELTDKEQFEIP